MTVRRSSCATRFESTVFALSICLLSILFGCSGDHASPTGATPSVAPMTPVGVVPSPTPSSELTSTAAGADVSASTASAAAGEEFNCTNLQERYVRFSDPGFVDHNRVGLYYKYVGVPAGRTQLELFWDEENAPSVSQVVELAGGEVQRNDDSRTDYEGIMEHGYSGITGETGRVVRANLISVGRTGNCATVRRITVTPEPPAEAGAGAPSCSPSGSGAFAGGNTQLGRIFRDGVPSGCGGKAYPGLFNAGTTYFYEVFPFTAKGSGPVCVRVNFDPNSGSTPCGTNAHASAYSGSYNPANQSANFLGDVGSSVTQPFQFTIGGGATFQVVVTNTASAQKCSYSFTVENTTCN